MDGHDTFDKRRIALFWSRVKKTDSCWLWTGQKQVRGYGRIAINGKRTGAHRFSWQLANGPIPFGMRILHRCDNPPCVRPSHLFAGTDLDNYRDAVAKGQRCWPANAKLSALDVLEIRQCYANRKLGTVGILAKRFRVNRMTIQRVARGKCWQKYLPMSTDSRVSA